MKNLNWIVKNWKKLSSSYMINYYDSDESFMEFIRDRGIVPTGKFFGTLAFLERHERFVSINERNVIRLCLRPFIVAPMPPDVLAVYIDPKRYKVNDKGEIIQSDSYEFMKFAFVTEYYMPE